MTNTQNNIVTSSVFIVINYDTSIYQVILFSLFDNKYMKEQITYKDSFGRPGFEMNKSDIHPSSTGSCEYVVRIVMSKVVNMTS